MKMCTFRKITGPPQPARVTAWQTWCEQPGDCHLPFESSVPVVPLLYLSAAGRDNAQIK